MTAATDPGAANDFMDLFRPNAPWTKTSSKIQIFKVTTQFLHRSTDAQLSTVIADLRRRHIALAFAAEIMAATAQCGNGVPGYTAKAVIQTAVDRVSKLGGKIDYVAFDSPMAFGHFNILNKPTACNYTTEQLVQNIAPQIAILAAGGEIKYLVMDEPLYYGHYYTQAPGKGAGCHSSIEQIAQLIKPTLDVYTQAFPNIVIGEVEPTFFIDGQTNWRSDVSSWADAYRETMGKPLAFLHLDVEWPLANGVQDALAVYNAAQDLQHRNLLGKIGVIYNGSRAEKSDAAWIKAARDHLLLMEGQHKLRPDHVIFQSWTTNPTHAMPESDPNALTSLVDFYFSPSVSGQIGAR
jgi:hypothetical protein